jgi:hypothetical protein
MRAANGGSLLLFVVRVSPAIAVYAPRFWIPNTHLVNDDAPLHFVFSHSERANT